MSQRDGTLPTLVWTDRKETSDIIKKDNVEGMRYCRKCEKLLPLDKFKLGQRRFMCKLHIRERVKMYTRGDRDRNAVFTIKQRAWVDMHYFKQARLNMTPKELISILTDEHKDHPLHWALMPVDPEQPISLENSIIIPILHRRMLMLLWRHTNDVQQYKDSVQKF